MDGDIPPIVYPKGLPRLVQVVTTDTEQTKTKSIRNSPAVKNDFHLFVGSKSTEVCYQITLKTRSVRINLLAHFATILPHQVL